MNTNHKEFLCVKHLNVRESMSFLITKLIVIELAASSLIIAFCLPLACIEQNFPFLKTLISPHVILFFILNMMKLCGSIWVVLQWLNEYYEITTSHIIHRFGILFRHEEKYELSSIGSLNIQQGFLARALNYGTIYFYDRTTRRYVFFYLIHNPVRYYRIIEAMLPQVNKVIETPREHLIEEQDESL